VRDISPLGVIRLLPEPPLATNRLLRNDNTAALFRLLSADDI
jgi:hypothetical protein